MKFLDTWDGLLNRLTEKRFYFGLLLLMTFGLAFLLAKLDLGLQRHFLIVACDSAAFQSAIVNTLNGHWFRDTAYDGPNFLGLHVTFVLLLLAPIYAAFPSVDTLFLLQVFGVYSALIPLYLVAWEELKRPFAAFLIAMTALMNPLLFQMAMAPFHPETWILAAALWSYYFYRRDQVIGFWLSMVFALSCGEQAALLYSAFGLALLCVEDGLAWRQRYGKFALVAGVVWLIVAVGIISPSLRHPDQQNLFAYNYANWSLPSDQSDQRVTSALDLAKALPQDPLHALLLLLNPVRWGHLAMLVGIPFFLCFLRRRELLLLAPFPVYFLMTDQEFFRNFHAYYYQFAFFAAYLGLIGFVARWEVSTRLGLTVFCAAFFLNFLVLSTNAARYVGFYFDHREGLNDSLHDEFAKIPVNAAVYGPHRFSAYLSNRENMVMGDLRDEKLDFNAMLNARYSTTNVRPEQIDYIVCDLLDDQCGWRQGGFSAEWTQSRTDNVQRLIKTGQWQMFWNDSHVVILRRVRS